MAACATSLSPPPDSATARSVAAAFGLVLAEVLRLGPAEQVVQLARIIRTVEQYIGFNSLMNAFFRFVTDYPRAIIAVILILLPLFGYIRKRMRGAAAS